MSEYVVTINAESYVLRGTFDVELREQIVRCRDCANAIERRATLADEPRTFYECEFFDLSEVEPDGFCKWGEREEKR